MMQSAPVRKDHYHFHGEMQRDGDIVLGWCWSPARPRERLRVALLIDGKRVSSTVAARLRLDIVRDGVCDGYHGFALPLAGLPSEVSIIEVMEIGTGRIFGRVMASELMDVRFWRMKIVKMAKSIERLHDEPYLKAQPTLLSAALSVSGHYVSKRQTPLDGNPQFPEGFRLRDVLSPKISLVLYAFAGSYVTMAAVIALAPVLGPFLAELIVVDDGYGSASAALAALPGLKYVHRRSDLEFSWLHLARTASKGDTMVILDPFDCGIIGVVEFLNRIYERELLIFSTYIVKMAQYIDPTFFFTDFNSPMRTGVIMSVAREFFSLVSEKSDLSMDAHFSPIVEVASKAQNVGIEVSRLLS